MNKFKNITLVQKLLIVMFTTILGFSQGIDCVPAKVTAVQLNVRSAPSISGNIIGRLSKGDDVCAYEQQGKWVRIEQGWISAKYLMHIYQALPQNSVSGATVSSPTTHYSYRQDINETTVVKSGLNEEIAISILVLIAAIYVVMLLFGMAGKVVVYYDEADLVISLLPWFTLFVTILLAGIYQPTEYDLEPEKMLLIQRIIWYIGASLAASFSIWAIWLSIKYNRNVPLGIAYGIFKLLSGLIGVLVLISQVFTMKDEKTKRKDFWFAILVFGSFWWLGKKLINGKKVYKNKGWSLQK